MVWLSHSKFPQCLLSSFGGSLCCSSPECHLRLIKPAAYKTSVHNLPSPDCLLTHLFHDSHYNLAIVSLSRTLDSSPVCLPAFSVFGPWITNPLDSPRPRYPAFPLSHDSACNQVRLFRLTVWINSVISPRTTLTLFSLCFSASPPPTRVPLFFSLSPVNHHSCSGTI